MATPGSNPTAADQLAAAARDADSELSAIAHGRPPSSDRDLLAIVERIRAAQRDYETEAPIRIAERAYFAAVEACEAAWEVCNGNEDQIRVVNDAEERVGKAWKALLAARQAAEKGVQ